jgi:hypothetical protein
MPCVVLQWFPKCGGLAENDRRKGIAGTTLRPPRTKNVPPDIFQIRT